MLDQCIELGCQAGYVDEATPMTVGQSAHHDTAAVAANVVLTVSSIERVAALLAVCSIHTGLADDAEVAEHGGGTSLSARSTVWPSPLRRWWRSAGSRAETAMLPATERLPLFRPAQNRLLPSL